MFASAFVCLLNYVNVFAYYYNNIIITRQVEIRVHLQLPRVQKKVRVVYTFMRSQYSYYDIYYSSRPVVRHRVF